MPKSNNSSKSKTSKSLTNGQKEKVARYYDQIYFGSVSNEEYDDLKNQYKDSLKDN